MSEVNLPSGWIVTALEKVTQTRSGNSTLIKGKLHKNFRSDLFPAYSASGQDVWHTEGEENGVAIILSAVGARCGKCFRTNSEKWSAIANTHIVFPIDSIIDRDYLWYKINDENFWIKGGTAQPFVKVKSSFERPFLLPPLNEQHRIVAKIEELFSELDKGIEALKIAREQLKIYRQALLKHAFEGKLTQTEVWRERTLGQLLGFLTSGSRGWAAYYAAKGDLFVRAQNIKHDFLELDDVAFVSLPNKTEGLRTRIQFGDLLVTITGANVTKAALVKHDLGVAYVSQHVALCRPTEEVRPEFLYWFIVAEAAGRKQLTEMAYGAGKPGLNLENIRSVRVPLPSLKDQQKIVELIESKLSETDQLELALTTSLQQSEALRQSILKRAFSGQLVAQDPHDEPAAVLLERILAEKVKSTPNAKNTRGKRNE